MKFHRLFLFFDFVIFGILLKAKTNGMVDKLKPLLNELTEKDEWISEKLKREILMIVGEE
jgi:predicted nucleic acid-binding protein